MRSDRAPFPTPLLVRPRLAPRPLERGLLAGALFVGAVFAGLGLGSAAPADAATRNYPAANRKAFVAACVDSATGSAPQVSAAGVRTYCGCLLGRYEARYSFAEFEALDRALSKGRKMTPAQFAFAQQAAKACASRLR